jgi:1-phosphatidylinositol-3-phosphate 5-kinase
MHDIQGWSSDNTSLDGTIKAGDVSFMDSKAPSEVNTLDNLGNTNQFQQAADGIQETLLRESGTHMRYSK